ncbi:hypothetical protein DFH06DRAFT_1346392 [Mycena polygramma]|nr:hypothetical protein DFH06DRAFT_1346392 [Mycena polygramma]
MPPKCHGAMLVDFEDEDELGTAATIVTSTKRMKQKPVVLDAKSKKKAKTAAAAPEPPMPPVEGDVDEDDDEENPSVERKQGMSHAMKMFTDVLDDLEEAIFQTKSHAGLAAAGASVQCACGQTALFRCPECGTGSMVCAQCLVRMHPGQTLHHIEKWDGGAFVRTKLFDLKHEIHLGHEGKRCEHASLNASGRTTIIVDTNGIHKTRIFYCRCENYPDDHIQLVRARLFPATIILPQTAFTFDVLHNFHVHNLTSKKTAQDYYRALQKLTNGAFPNQVEDRYREFLLYAVPLVRRHLYTFFLSSDGNFKLQRKRKVDDPDDVALNGGNAYFPEDTRYQAYVKELQKQGPADDKCTCSDLKAVRLQNIAKFKNSVISGVVAVQCARHGFFMPGGMVDLTKGEGYGHTDYALGHSLADAHDHRWIVLTYDVYCQYYKNITTRFVSWFPSLVGLVKRLTGAVPKMHIRNHIAQCQTQWSTNFEEYLAFLIGELIEGSWAELNQFAGSTKETNHGHRHDILDDGCGQWNWDKVIQMGETLLRMYREACAAVRKRSPVFEQLSEATDPELLAEWTALPKKWEFRKGVYWSPYQVNLKNGPPTHRGAYEKLITAELAKSIERGTVCGGNTEFISKGLRLEQLQHKITRTLRTSTTDNAVAAKASLRKELTVWRVSQYERFPALQSEIGAESSITVEKQKLFLPSSFNETRRITLGMQDLARTEFTLREGQAHDALEDVRVAIKTFNFNVAFKITQVKGQSANTRAQNFLRTLANDRIVAADQYRVARAALLNLGLSDPSLQPLINDELYAKNTRDAPKMGDSGAVDPWFWTVGRPANLTPREQKEWSVEMDRAKWCRDRANRDRAVEQKELLEEEFPRTIESFRKNAAAFRAIAGMNVSRSGRAAYAHLKDVMYTKLAEDCIELHKSAPGLAEKDREAEEAAAEEELRKKGRLNQKLSDSYKDYLPVI